MREIRAGLTVLGFVAAMLASEVLRAGDVIRATFNAIKEPVSAMHRKKPATGVDGCVEQLAKEIDWLEHHIDAYGTIVAKQPDVWGQSRLTQHRFEFEEIMAQQLDKFEVRLSGALRRSDQAYLGMAMSLQAAVNGETTPPSIAEGTNQLSVVNELIADPNGDDDVITRTAPFGQPDPQTSFSVGEGTISLEPSTQLNQMSRYLQHLQELRRINEGDDTADSPGYSLNLVRIPISVIPGGHTRKGYGAEITITATPYISEELLPTTFRNLVINDLVDLLAPAITFLANDKVSRKLAADIVKKDIETLPFRADYVAALEEATAEAYSADAAPKWPAAQEKSIRDQAMIRAGIDAAQAERFHQLEEQEMQFSEEIRKRMPSQLGVSLSRSRRARMPMPPSQLIEVFGVREVSALVLRAYIGLFRSPTNVPVIHLMDVQAFLSEELQGSYDLLATPDHEKLWLECPLDTLAVLIRERRFDAIKSCRNSLTGELINEMSPEAGKGDVGKFEVPDAVALDNPRRVTAGLAWAIIVESALLNERLVQDVREASISKGCACMSGEWMPFYGPNPPPEARVAFIEYVKCRWPIIVFAIDPVAEEQNIADEFSRRRELQLAASMAFAAGNINAQALMRFTRRLEWDMATIALNRTIIGFSHNNDTFGWRFYPRFQTPPIRGTIAAFGETLFGGPTTDQDMRQRQLEVGQRECTAIVIMPSFVPYVTFDTRANWFQLTHPKHTELSMRDTMTLSRSIKSMQNSRFACMRYAGAYRDGEIHRLLRRVDQLERELPLQTMQVQVPYENTLGGFEMFNQGVTDLAPELISWYGEPGIDSNATTKLFLVGDHFSLHATKIIAGGKPVTFKMLSRQVLEAEIPPGVAVLDNPEGDVDLVDLHLATPYGISSHLLVPLASAGSLSSPGDGEIGWRGTPQIAMSYKLTDTDKKNTVATMSPYFEADPKSFAIETPRSAPFPATAKLNLFVWHDSRAIGSYTVDSVPFDPRSGEYYLAGNSLKSAVVGSSVLEGVLSNYLKRRADAGQTVGTATFSVEASLIVDSKQMPIAGQLTVTVTKE